MNGCHSQEATMMKSLQSLALVLALAIPVAAAERAPQHAVNLNSATVTELMQLPRIGAKTAERIVAFRKQHGGFLRPEELMNVKGIGEKSFARLKPHLTVGAAPASRPAPVRK
jgi:competence protein ComEA